MATTYSLKGRDPTFAYDETNSLVGVINSNGSVNRFSGKTYTSPSTLSVVAVETTFGAATMSAQSGRVLITGAGAHGLTGAVAINALGTGVYISWTNGVGVAGIYTVNAIATDTTGTTIRLQQTITSSTVTVTATNPAVITYANHGRAVNDTFQFTTTTTLPTGLSLLTTYYVKTVLSANTFTVSASPGGAAIACTDTGTGTHTAILWLGTPAVSAKATAIPMATLTIDGNTFTPGGKLEIDALFTFTNSTNAKRVQITYGGALNYLLDTGAGGYGSVASATMNKIAYARGGDTVICSSPASVGHGTSTAATQALTIAYNTDLPLVFNTSMAAANEVTTLYAYQVEVS